MYAWMKALQSKVSDPKRKSTYLAHPCTPSRRAFIARALHIMIQNEWNVNSWLVVTITRTTEAILELLGVQDSNEKSALRERFILALGNAAALAALQWDFVAQFGSTEVPGTQIEELYENALVAAAYLNDLPLINLLLEKGVDPDVETRLFGHPLNAATSKSHEPAVRLLLQKGSRVWPCYWKLMTPLHWAALNGDVKLLRLLMKQKGATTYLTQYERRILPPFTAYPYPSPPPEDGFQRINLGMFLRLPHARNSLIFPRAINLDTPDTVPFPVPRNSDTPLDLAVCNGHLDAVKYLLAQEKDKILGGCPNFRCRGLASLAVQYGHDYLVPVLITPGVENPLFKVVLAN